MSEHDGPEDPMSELGAAAASMHEIFTSYIDAGFTRGEALEIVIAIATANIRPPES